MHNLPDGPVSLNAMVGKIIHMYASMKLKNTPRWVHSRPNNHTFLKQMSTAPKQFYKALVDHFDHTKSVELSLARCFCHRCCIGNDCPWHVA